MLQFQILDRDASPPSEGLNRVYLIYDRWNDYSFITMFYVYAHDEFGKLHDLGNVKIGFKGQTTSNSTKSTLNGVFSLLPPNYFSLGTDLKYYRVLGHDLSSAFRDSYTLAMQDVVGQSSAYNTASGEEVFRVSLLRDVSVNTIEGQFRRVLQGGVPLTDFNFSYIRPKDVETAGVNLSFSVIPNSTPTTNVHAIIGRNGIGKTTILNGMITAITNKVEAKGEFKAVTWLSLEPIDEKYFSSLVSVAFSAFDPFAPPPEQPDPEKGTCYFYIGLKDIQDDSGTLLKSIKDVHEEFVTGLSDCFRLKNKRDRWVAAIQTLESDDNFAEMGLTELANYSGEDLKTYSRHVVRRMSSGHAIVLLTITRLIAKMEEKTLVLLDEPESHLHPPLLSAFMRALSELLVNRNGVAIIATHSPVVLQEVPKSCVWVLTRSGLTMTAERPSLETFGENVGVLTREVFRLEVAKSGFHSLLKEAVFTLGKSYDEVVADYGNQLGFEAKSILKAMVIERDRWSTPQ